jgi:threonine synthase
LTALQERWRERLPVTDATPVVSLGEGGTPLLHAPRLSAELGCELWLKWEGANPTGSYTDRGMTIAIAKAVEAGADAVVCASTGNTSASAAAYAARAGLRAVVLLPQGGVALGKLAQARAAGARLLIVRGSFDQALDAARELGRRGTHVLVNSLNPDRLQGQKTAAFEVVEQLGGAPDLLTLPYGGGGNTRAYALGFQELGIAQRIVSVQAERRGKTVASAIRITAPAHRTEAEAAAEVVTVGDREIVRAWQDVAQLEGIFCEPASAAGLAGLRAQPPEPGSRVVCVLTGHGLKDPGSVDGTAAFPVEVEPDADAIAEAAA